MLDRLAGIIAIIFQPIFVPLYGLFFLDLSGYFYPEQETFRICVLLMILFLEVIFPACAYITLYVVGKVSTFQADDRNERVLPYSITLCCYFICSLMLMYIGVYKYLTVLMFCVAITLSILVLVNFFWKISAHACGVGGLLGAILFVSWQNGVNATEIYCIGALVAAVVVWSRIQLKAHSDAQLLFGFVTGAAGTWLLPSLLM